MLDNPKQAGPLDRPIDLTFFKDRGATVKKDGAMTLRALASRILNRNAPSKEALPWLKLATFGNRVTDRGSLRNNDNVLAATGVELDYDKGQIPLPEAAELLEKAGVCALLYTSPSHKPEFPKWRVLAPFSEAMDGPARAQMVGRIAGLFFARYGANVFDAASWTLSQSFFYGYVANDEGFYHKVVLVDGEEVDLHDKLDEIAVGRPNTRPRHDDAGMRATDTSERPPLDLGMAEEDVLTGRNFHMALLSIAGHYVARGMDEDEILELLDGLMQLVPVEVRRANARRWKERSSQKHLRGVIAYCLERERKTHRFRDYDRSQREQADEDETKQESDDAAQGEHADDVVDDAGHDDGLHPKRILLSSASFISSWRPPVYTVDGILQSDFIYSLTAPTSHGKTALALHLACCIALGRPFHGHPVEQGSILFCAGENPADIMARYMIMADRLGFDPQHPAFHFIDGVIKLKTSLPRIREEAADIPNLRLVIIDTAAAYFDGDNQNDNAQAIAYGRTLRRLTTLLPHHPTVIANCHPKKGAGREDLVPMGGSAFLNEIDGNITLWKDADENLTMGRHGKFRGPEFSDLRFKLDNVSSPKVVDAKGRELPSVMARPLGFIEAEADDEQAVTDRRMLLSVIYHNSGLSLRQLAEKLGWHTASGAADHSRVGRKCRGLEEHKLLRRDALSGKWTLTLAGKKAIGVKDDDPE
ncbi:MAG: AAA family ATPase [Tardiphaga sp.]